MTAGTSPRPQTMPEPAGLDWLEADPDTAGDYLELYAPKTRAAIRAEALHEAAMWIRSADPRGDHTGLLERLADEETRPHRPAGN